MLIVCLLIDSILDPGDLRRDMLAYDNATSVLLCCVWLCVLYVICAMSYVVVIVMLSDANLVLHYIYHNNKTKLLANCHYYEEHATINTMLIDIPKQRLGAARS